MRKPFSALLVYILALLMLFGSKLKRSKPLAAATTVVGLGLLALLAYWIFGGRESVSPCLCFASDSLCFSVGMKAENQRSVDVVNTGQLPVLCSLKVATDKPQEVTFKTVTSDQPDGRFRLEPGQKRTIEMSVSAAAGAGSCALTAELRGETVEEDAREVPPARGEGKVNIVQLAFDRAKYEVSINRDYNQRCPIAVDNTGQTDVVCALRVRPQGMASGRSTPEGFFGEDLVLSFIGEGSDERPLRIAAGNSQQVLLVLHAQDARQEKHDFLLDLFVIPSGGGEPVHADTAALVVFIIMPNVKLEITELEQRRNPSTLARTFVVKNGGDTLTDLCVRPEGKFAGEVALWPTMNHANLPTGGSIEFNIRPIMCAGFRKTEGDIVVQGASARERIHVVFELPPGKQIFIGRVDPGAEQTVNDSYCTNRPQVDVPLGLLDYILGKTKPGMDKSQKAILNRLNEYLKGKFGPRGIIANKHAKWWIEQLKKDPDKTWTLLNQRATEWAERWERKYGKYKGMSEEQITETKRQEFLQRKLETYQKWLQWVEKREQELRSKGIVIGELDKAAFERMKQALNDYLWVDANGKVHGDPRRALEAIVGQHEAALKKMGVLDEILVGRTKSRQKDPFEQLIGDARQMVKREATLFNELSKLKLTAGVAAEMKLLTHQMNALLQGGKLSSLSDLQKQAELANKMLATYQKAIEAARSGEASIFLTSLNESSRFWQQQAGQLGDMKAKIDKFQEGLKAAETSGGKWSKVGHYAKKVGDAASYAQVALRAYDLYGQGLSWPEACAQAASSWAVQKGVGKLVPVVALGDVIVGTGGQLAQYYNGGKPLKGKIPGTDIVWEYGKDATVANIVNTGVEIVFDATAVAIDRLKKAGNQNVDPCLARISTQSLPGLLKAIEDKLAKGAPPQEQQMLESTRAKLRQEMRRRVQE